MAGRRPLASEVRGGQEKPPRARGRGGDLEEPPCQGRRLGGATRGVVAAQAQGGLEELFHVHKKYWPIIFFFGSVFGFGISVMVTS